MLRRRIIKSQEALLFQFLSESEVLVRTALPIVKPGDILKAVFRHTIKVVVGQTTAALV